MATLTLEELTRNAESLVEALRMIREPVIVYSEGRPLGTWVPAMNEPLGRPRYHAGMSSHTGRIVGDLNGPLGEEWEAMKE